MKIERSFLPVGQGGFCVETFETSGDKAAFVYDCGSISGGNRIKRLSRTNFQMLKRLTRSLFHICMPTILTGLKN